MAEERVQRRLAAILAADVVGYSRLMGIDEAGTLARLKILRAELFDPKTAEYGGRIVKTTGDGVLVEFPSAVDAVQHAIDVQQEMARRNAGAPEDQRIELRIGVNLGDVIVDGDDIYGDGVNVAARLEGLAQPGGICLSDLVQASIRNKLDIALEDLGEKSLKNITEPVRVYRVVLEAKSHIAAATDALFRRPAVAVLPFENLSGDPEQEYFADGLTEDIITALSLWRSFPVIARNSTFTYKGTAPNIRKVGEELGARYVIEGSVRKAGNRVRVTAQLINSETAHHVWSERYDRELADIFELQDEITQKIAAMIDPEIERAERKKLVAKPPRDLTAWELCLEGRSLMHSLERDENHEARTLFLNAIKRDPTYSRAYSGLALTYANEIRFFWTPQSDELADRLYAAARQAVTLDENDAEARIMLSRAYLQRGELNAALAEAQTAVQLNPSNTMANTFVGTVLALASGRYEEGIPWYKKGLQFNPIGPQRLMTSTQLALAYLGSGDLLSALQLGEEALRQSPEFWEAIAAVGSILGHLDRGSEATSEIGMASISIAGMVKRHPIYCDELKDIVLDGLRKAGLLE